MAVLSLNYRCRDRLTPLYLRHVEVEAIAGAARRQLVGPDADAIPLDVLRDIEGLAVNGLEFALWVDTEHAVSDEHGQPVLGLCEFDPGAGVDAAILSVSPAGGQITEELVLSTFGHELGHGVFDAPGWIKASKSGPGLFEPPAEILRKTYRTLTRDAEHLNGSPAAANNAMARISHSSVEAERERELRFAELRANEFMGSFLVPRDRLIQAAVELAPEFDVAIEPGPTLFDDLMPGPTRLIAEGTFDFVDMDSLQRAIAKRLGVHRRFIEVRMERYGLFTGAKPR